MCRIFHYEAFSLYHLAVFGSPLSQYRLCSVVVKAQMEPDCPNSNPSSYYICDLEKLTEPFSASVFSRVKYGYE